MSNAKVAKTRGKRRISTKPFFGKMRSVLCEMLQIMFKDQPKLLQDNVAQHMQNIFSELCLLN